MDTGGPLGGPGDRGAPYRGGHALPPGRAPYLVGPLVALRWPSSAIWSLSMGKKNHKPSSRTKLRYHEAEPWRTNLELWQSCSAGDTSLREGEIIAIVSTNAPLIGEGNLHQHLHQHHLLSNPSSSLVSNSCLQVGIGASRLLVVLITPYS